MPNADQALIEPPCGDLPIERAKGGFYNGFSKNVTITSKVLISLLVVWIIAFPNNAEAILSTFNRTLLTAFASWYVYVTALFVLICLGLALHPRTGSVKLGLPDEKPEFSSFSWFAMMFGAGIGIGMLTYSTAEPIAQFQTNPDVIRGQVEGGTAEAIRSAYKYSFLHWGLNPWGAYALTGLALAFVAYRRNLPLTIRSALCPLFGRVLSGILGHIIDIIAVVATVLGVSQTVGYGVEQFVAGLYRIGFGDWIIAQDGTASNSGIIFALTVIVGGATLSALSGVGRGIKWLSNINMVLSFGLLAFFVVAGSQLFALKALLIGIFDYLVALPQLLFTVWKPDGTETGDALATWQGDWTIFYWGWWISFSPFVGLFLARVSRGRTIREFILGAMIVPSIMCFLWFVLIGGTAIDLELSGVAQNSIIDAGISDQLFATFAVMLSENMAQLFSILAVVLLLTYLITSADSAVLIINTINAGGDEGPKAHPHILFWSTAIALVVGALLIIGGVKAIQTAMIIGALPFSFLIFLMGASVIKATIRDSIREKHGVDTYIVPTEGNEPQQNA